jgi:hypothetical protein
MSALRPQYFIVIVTQKSTSFAQTYTTNQPNQIKPLKVMGVDTMNLTKNSPVYSRKPYFAGTHQFGEPMRQW